MGKIFITGDTHMPINIDKLQENNFKLQKKLKRNDYVIIAGDFGIWDLSEGQKRWREWFNNKNFTTLFIDGNHENFDLLNSFPLEMWNGGKIHRVYDNVIHLMRGQIFTIDGLKFFTMGGGDSIDKMDRIPNISWWREELPSFKEYDEGLENLENNNWEVDYIVSHSCSNYMFYKLNLIYKLYPIYTALNTYFDRLEKEVCFKHWYFGHYHCDIQLDDKHTALFNNIIQIK